MSRTVLSVVLGLCVLFGTARSAGATPILDQYSNSAGVTIGTNGVRQSFLFAQTFTPALSGRLSAIEILLSNAAYGDSTDLVIAITALQASGAPDIDATLGSLSVPIESLPQLARDVYRFELDELNLFLSPGTQVAFVLSTSSGFCCDFWMWGAPIDAYVGGLVWRNGSPWIDNGAGFDPRRHEDMWFRTFVDPAARVPDVPTTLPLVGVSLVAMVLIRKWT